MLVGAGSRQCSVIRVKASVKKALATGLSSAVVEREEQYAKIACGLWAVKK